MGQVLLAGTDSSFRFATAPGETLLGALRRNSLPLLSSLILDEDDRFVSLRRVLDEGEEVTLYATRNSDYGVVRPRFGLAETPEAVTELIRPAAGERSLALVQFSRPQALDYAYDCVRAHLDEHVLDQGALRVQVALSAGGDSRALAECLNRYSTYRPAVHFHCVITPNGAEDEIEHVTHAVRIAEEFGLEYETFDSKSAARLAGLSGDLTSLTEDYRAEFPLDEIEVLGTYFVQEVNLAVARRDRVTSVIFGFNQEDVVADVLYQMISGRALGVFPRSVGGIRLLAPLSDVPKKLIDSLDVANSLRNYRARVSSVGDLRSALYLIAHLVAERFPEVADSISSRGFGNLESSAVDEWLDRRRV